MFLLIKNADVYTPNFLGKKDILTCAGKIIKIEDEIDLPLKDIKVIDGTGKKIIPGLIDPHIHITGGGGEGSFKTRVPEVMLTDLTKSGITTVVGLLGTDTTTRCVENLLAKTKALNEEGITAYCLTGGYEYPSPTFTGKVKKDITFVNEILGVKLAISDHRSSVIQKEELAKLAADVRVAGMFSGKVGIITLHMGSGKDGLNTINEILNTTDIPINHFRPAHVARDKKLFDEAMEFAKRGGYIDITTGGSSGFNSLKDIIRTLIEKEVPLEKVTFSSDGNGSLPVFDTNGKLLEIKAAPCNGVFNSIRKLMIENEFPFENIIKFATSNVANSLGIFPEKGCIQEGSSADLLLLDENFLIDTLISKGKIMIENKNIIVKGTYEKF